MPTIEFRLDTSGTQADQSMAWHLHWRPVDTSINPQYHPFG